MDDNAKRWVKGRPVHFAAYYDLSYARSPKHMKEFLLTKKVLKTKLDVPKIPYVARRSAALNPKVSSD